jgi:hypothetical protein
LNKFEYLNKTNLEKTGFWLTWSSKTNIKKYLNIRKDSNIRIKRLLKKMAFGSPGRVDDAAEPVGGDDHDDHGRHVDGDGRRRLDGAAQAHVRTAEGPGADFMNQSRP